MLYALAVTSLSSTGRLTLRSLSLFTVALITLLLLSPPPTANAQGMEFLVRLRLAVSVDDADAPPLALETLARGGP